MADRTTYPGMSHLVGIGIYSPAEASRLVGVPAAKIRRWLNGHEANGKFYDPLWTPQARLEDGELFLGFRDLMEVRVAAAFIASGVPALRVREAICVARAEHGLDHPLSLDRFRYSGREIFLRVFERNENGEERERLLNTFRKQYAFKEVLEPALKHIEFTDGKPSAWWPNGKSGLILLDPERAFGQPIDAKSSVPTTVLAVNAKANGAEATAKAFDVPLASVRRAVAFEDALHARMAA